MFVVGSNLVRGGKLVAFGLLLSVALASPFAAYGKKKASDAPAQPAAPAKPNDFSKLVWPGPPDVARIRYLDYFAGMKIENTPASEEKKKKQGWMDRLAGTPEGAEKQEKMLKDFPYQLIGPYGVGVDSKGLVYVADQKVGAIFIFNTETRDVQLIKNGSDAHFGWINGIALDDNDRLFVSDGKLGQVIVFNPMHKAEGLIKEGIVDPNGLAIDTENRILYVVDTQQDQVLVYDADTYKLLRRIGTAGKKHSLTAPGDFAAPTNVAVDGDGNVYVTDTLNNRVEIFDAGGNFISTFGKNCDAPGCFERPKGIAVDSDGNIWVADAMMDRLQILNREGQVEMVVGGHGTLPSQFSDLVGVGFDKVRNRIFTTEQYPGRMQEFRYVTEEEVRAEKTRAGKERQAQNANAKAAAETVVQPEDAQSPKVPAGGQQSPEKPAPAGAGAPAAK
jgi:DNA-binding beta-propeller fold protein YncE